MRGDFTPHAAMYLDIGLCPLPAKLKGKHPALPGWRKFQKRRPTHEEIDQWLAPNSRYDAICIVCGEVSGRLEAIDFDQQGRAFEKWRELVESEQPGLVERLVIQKTQSGGFHVLYRCPSGVEPMQKLAMDHSKKVLIETRGEGGLILCAPSPGYEVVHGNFAEIRSISADERETLLVCARMLDERSPEIVDGPRPSTDRTGSDGLRPGDDFNLRGDIGPSLETHGWRRSVTKDANEHWTRPGKERGTSATFNGTHFYVFSSNAEPFDAGRAYTKFAVMAFLEHAEDFSAAARELRREGFGQTDVTVVSTPDFDDVKDVSPDLDPGPLPSHLMQAPGFVGEVIDYTMSVAPRPNLPMAFSAAIALQSTLAGRRVVDGCGVRTNLLMLAVAPSGSGKDAGRQTNRRILEAAGLHYLEGPEDLASDSGLVNAVEEQPVVLLQLDEVGRMLRTTGDAKRAPHLFGIVTALLRLYSTSSTSYQGKAYAETNRRKRIVYPCLTVYGTTVPEHLFGGLSLESLTDGFLGRAIIIDTDATPKARRREFVAVPQKLVDIARWWGNFRPSCASRGFCGEPLVVRTTPDATRVLERFSDEIDGMIAEDDPAGRAVFARAAEKASKLALIHACSRAAVEPADRREGALVIDEESADWGCAVSRHLSERMLYIARHTICEGEFDRMQKKTWQAIEKHPKGVTRSQLTRATQWMTPRDRDSVIQNLKDAGRVEEIQVESATKPTIVYRAIT